MVIPEEYDECRLDKCVSELMGEKLSRSAIQKMIKSGEVQVNDKTVEKASFVVHMEDVITFSIPDPIQTDILAQDIPISVLYEDEDLLVVDKPKGMVVHPSPGHLQGTLVNALLFYCKDGLSGINGVLRPGIVHRIDMDTSGSLVVCKNDNAHQQLAARFQTHSIQRKYYAICCGNIKDDYGTIDKPIGRHPVDRKKMAVVDITKGKRAITHFHVLERFGNYTFVECSLETGRTHQIRVHMASIGFPLLGDLVYGNKDYKGMGQILHAGLLGFVHPRTGEYLEVVSPLPEYFQNILLQLRNKK